MFRLHFFKKSSTTSLCSADFENKQEVETINLKFLLSLSDMQKFSLPLSGKYIADYALVTMSNNDKYYIDKKSFDNLKLILAGIK